MSGRRLRFDPRQAAPRIAAVFLALVAMNAAFAVVFLRPRMASLQEQTTDSAPSLTRLRQRQAQVAALEQFAAILRKTTEDLRHLRRDVLSTRDRRLIEVQLELARLVQQFHVSLERIQYSNDILEEEAIDRLAMTVPLQGGYASLRRFIEAVEGSKQFLVIERVALVQDSEGGAQLALNITLATYFDSPQSREEPRGGRRRGAASA